MTRIAVVQMDASADNLNRAADWIAAAAREGADFVLLPELANVPWLPAREEPDLLAWAEEEDGPSLTALREAAARHRINLIAPIFERAGAHRYSTAFVIDRAGQVVGRYRKNHIPYEPGWYEKFYYEPGDSGYPVFEHEGLRFGIQICWDNMFIEGSRILALQGADVIFSPRATGFGSLDLWRAVLQTNAAVNHCYLFNANRVGEDRTTRFGGGSLVADPYGRVVAEAPEAKPCLLVADVDRAALEQSRARQPFFENRRPGLYSLISRG